MANSPNIANLPNAPSWAAVVSGRHLSCFNNLYHSNEGVANLQPSTEMNNMPEQVLSTTASNNSSNIDNNNNNNNDNISNGSNHNSNNNANNIINSNHNNNRNGNRNSNSNKNNSNDNSHNQSQNNNNNCERDSVDECRGEVQPSLDSLRNIRDTNNSNDFGALEQMRAMEPTRLQDQFGQMHSYAIGRDQEHEHGHGHGHSHGRRHGHGHRHGHRHRHGQSQGRDTGAWHTRELEATQQMQAARNRAAAHNAQLQAAQMRVARSQIALLQAASEAAHYQATQQSRVGQMISTHNQVACHQIAQHQANQIQVAQRAAQMDAVRLQALELEADQLQAGRSHSESGSRHNVDPAQATSQTRAHIQNETIMVYPAAGAYRPNCEEDREQNGEQNRLTIAHNFQHEHFLQKREEESASHMTDVPARATPHNQNDDGNACSLHRHKYMGETEFAPPMNRGVQPFNHVPHSQTHNYPDGDARHYDAEHEAQASETVNSQSQSIESVRITQTHEPAKHTKRGISLQADAAEFIPKSRILQKNLENNGMTSLPTPPGLPPLPPTPSPSLQRETSNERRRRAGESLNSNMDLSDPALSDLQARGAAVFLENVDYLQGFRGFIHKANDLMSPLVVDIYGGMPPREVLGACNLSVPRAITRLMQMPPQLNFVDPYNANAQMGMCMTPYGPIYSNPMPPPPPPPLPSSAPPSMQCGMIMSCGPPPPPTQYGWPHCLPHGVPAPTTYNGMPLWPGMLYGYPPLRALPCRSPVGIQSDSEPLMTSSSSSSSFAHSPPSPLMPQATSSPILAHALTYDRSTNFAEHYARHHAASSAGSSSSIGATTTTRTDASIYWPQVEASLVSVIEVCAALLAQLKQRRLRTVGTQTSRNPLEDDVSVHVPNNSSNTTKNKKRKSTAEQHDLSRAKCKRIMLTAGEQTSSRSPRVADKSPPQNEKSMSEDMERHKGFLLPPSGNPSESSDSCIERREFAPLHPYARLYLEQLSSGNLEGAERTARILQSLAVERSPLRYVANDIGGDYLSGIASGPCPFGAIGSGRPSQLRKQQRLMQQHAKTSAYAVHDNIGDGLDVGPSTSAWARNALHARQAAARLVNGMGDQLQEHNVLVNDNNELNITEPSGAVYFSEHH